MHECVPKHFGIGTARMKGDKQKTVKIERSKSGNEIK